MSSGTPRDTEPRLGCYLYCFALAQPYTTREELRGPVVHPPHGSRATHGSPLAPLTTHHSPLTPPPTVDPRYGLRATWCGEIAAIWSHVGFDQFHPEKFEAGAADPQTIAAVAVRHDEVTTHVMQAAPVLPLKLCTLFTREQHLGAFLADHAQQIFEFLQKIRHQQEWGVKVFLVSGALAPGQSVAEQSGTEQYTSDHRGGLDSGATTSAGPGIRYFQCQREQRRRREQAHGHAARGIAEVERTLRRFTPDIQPLSLRTTKIAGRRDELLWNVACLVDREQLEALRHQLDTLGHSLQKAGLLLEMTGPWAPYSFCPSLDERSG